MGSRIRENPQKTFDLFFEAACPTSEDADPQVLRQFPTEFDDQESVQMLPRFCFPFDVQRVKESPMVQHFTFALTDMEGNQRFGFCRLAGGGHSCLCILSYLPWFEVFYKLLNNIADHLAKQQLTELDEFLSALYCHPVPQSNSPISLEIDSKLTQLKITTGNVLNGQCRQWSGDPAGGTPSYFIAPDSSNLPTIPESRNLTEFVLAVDVNNMLQLYGSLLYERRILLTASKLSTLTACVQTSSSMLYPMHWQHIYIPTLPPHLLDYCCAPMPYLIGVHASLMERVRGKALEDVVILNIDTNTLESPFQDLQNLPSDVVSLLKLQLKKQSATTGDGVARAFLRAQALLFGTYRDALVCTPGHPISFCQETFLQHKSSAMRAFLHHAVHLQLFKQFIDSRLEKLNAGEGFSDIFEQEITNSGFSAGNMRSYQLWMDSLKKGGGAFISTMRNKTNPAVRNMYRYAKGQAKIGLKGMRSRLMYKELSANPHLQRGNSLYSDQLSGPTLPRSSQSECLQSRLPITQHFGKSRPRRPNKRPSGTEPEAESSVDSDDPQEPDPFSNAGGDLDPSFLEPGELDLLGEIFETLSLSAPGHAGGMLYGTRSLDFASLHEGSCYARLHPSEETLSTLLLEGLEEEDSLSLEETSLPRSPAQEDFGMPPQPASHLPAKVTQRGSGMWDGGIQEREEEEEVAAAAAPPPPQMRAEELEAPTSPTTPQGKDAQITDSPGSPETSEPGERETESCSAAEAGQGAPGAPSRAGIQSSRRPLRASAGTNPDTGAGAAADLPNSLPALPKVSELRKRFEA